MPEAVSDLTGSAGDVTRASDSWRRGLGVALAASALGITSERYLSVAPLPGEEWRPFPGSGGFYSVSNLGRAKRRARTVERSDRRYYVLLPKVLCPYVSAKGYLVVSPERNGRSRNVKLHKAVCAAFEVPGVGPHTRHLDGNPQNNQAGNLMRGTPKENAADAALHARVRGTRRKSKLTDEDIIAIRSLVGVPSREAAKRFGISKSYVSAIRSGARWRGL